MNYFREAGQVMGWQAIHRGRAAGLMMVCGLVLVFVSAAMIFSGASAQPVEGHRAALFAQGAAGGKAIFDEKCAGCHTIGGGKLVGPDLQGVTQRRDPTWLRNFLLDTTGMLASDPEAKKLLQEYNNVTMPNMGLTEDEVSQLIAFMDDPSAIPAAQAPVIPAGAGDPVVGQKLFTGEQSLTNGGPHCIACHSVRGTGSLGGGGLGPDLTEVYQRFGEAGLSASLKNVVYPTMIGPFKNRPLTVQEQADLVAFFRESDRWQPPVSAVSAGALSAEALLVFAIGLVIAGLLFGLLWFFWLRIKKNHAAHLPSRKV